MPESGQLEAAVVETLKGAINENGQFALIRATRPGAAPSGAENIDLAVPVQMLPKLLGLVLHLIESADGMTRRRCFDAAAVEVADTEDGRQALAFELVLGTKIAIAIDDGQARKISKRLADAGASPRQRKAKVLLRRNDQV